MCKSCENEVYKKKDYSECKCMEKMTVEQYDKFFCDRKTGCPYYQPKEKFQIAV